jgi:hypothetical protein
MQGGINGSTINVLAFKMEKFRVCGPKSGTMQPLKVLEILKNF